MIFLKTFMEIILTPVILVILVAFSSILFFFIGLIASHLGVNVCAFTDYTYIDLAIQGFILAGLTFSAITTLIIGYSLIWN